MTEQPTAHEGLAILEAEFVIPEAGEAVEKKDAHSPEWLRRAFHDKNILCTLVDAGDSPFCFNFQGVEESRAVIPMFQTSVMLIPICQYHRLIIGRDEKGFYRSQIEGKKHSEPRPIGRIRRPITMMEHRELISIVHPTRSSSWSIVMVNNVCHYALAFNPLRCKLIWDPEQCCYRLLKYTQDAINIRRSVAFDLLACFARKLPQMVFPVIGNARYTLLYFELREDEVVANGYTVPATTLVHCVPNYEGPVLSTVLLENKNKRRSRIEESTCKRYRQTEVAEESELIELVEEKPEEERKEEFIEEETEGKEEFIEEEKDDNPTIDYLMATDDLFKAFNSIEEEKDDNPMRDCLMSTADLFPYDDEAEKCDNINDTFLKELNESIRNGTF